MLLKIFVVCMTIILTACGGGGGDNTNSSTQNPPAVNEVQNPPNYNGTENQPVADVSLASGVVVLSEKTKNSIIASDANTVTFSGEPTDSIKSGTVFIIGEDARKVVSVTTVNGNTLVSTVQPSIVEVFSSIKLDADIALTSQNIDQKSLATGISIEKPSLSNTAVGILTTTTSSNGITLAIQDEKFLDLNTNGSVRMVNPNIKINYEWKNGDLVKPAQIKFTSSTDVNLNFDSKESHGGSKSYPLFSFRVPVPVPILGGTLIIHIPVNLKLEAKLNGELNVGFTNNSILDFSVSAQNVNAPLIVANNSTNNFSFKTPTLKTELNLGAYIQPDVSLSIILFDIGGFKNTGGVSVVGTLEQDVGGQFKNCIHVTADAKASATAYLMLPIKPFTFKADIYDQSWRLYEGNTGVNAVCNLTVTPINDSLAIGSVRQFKAEIKDTFNNPVSITPTLQWESSDPMIATVSATGLVTGVKEGSTKITVTDVDSKRSATATVTVNLPIITITPAIPVVNHGSSVQLKATATDQQGHPLSVSGLIWASNNAGVTVSNTGLVSAASTATGKAVITAKDPVSGAIDTVIITMKENLSITPTKPSVIIGSNIQLSAIATNQNGEPLSVSGLIWTSNNSNITVNSNGLVTAASTAKIGESAVITVKDPVSGASDMVTISTTAIIKITPVSPFVIPGENIQLTATNQNGEPLSVSGLIWTSNNSNATVSNTGLVTTSSQAKGSVLIKVEDPTSGATDTTSILLDSNCAITRRDAIYTYSTCSYDTEQKYLSEIATNDNLYIISISNYGLDDSYCNDQYSTGKPNPFEDRRINASFYYVRDKLPNVKDFYCNFVRVNSEGITKILQTADKLIIAKYYVYNGDIYSTWDESHFYSSGALASRRRTVISNKPIETMTIYRSFSESGVVISGSGEYIKDPHGSYEITYDMVNAVFPFALNHDSFLYKYLHP